MTLREWKTVADGITKETEERVRRGEPYAKEDAILSAERRYGLEFVELAPDGSVIGLIEKKGSKWALFVGISCDEGSTRGIHNLDFVMDIAKVIQEKW